MRSIPDQGPLFAWTPPPPQANTREMHRRNDRQTSIDASEQIAKCRTPLQAKVLDAFLEFGPMTDGELETLDRFSDLAPSTARCRRKDLRNLGLVEDTGTTRKHGRSSMIVWRAVTK